MNAAFRFYRILNLLSIDVAIGAVCSALFFARILDVQILQYGIMSLALTVWIIYTADHLLDARRIKKNAATERHQFHQRHFKILAASLFTAVVIDGIVILFIRRPVFVSGLFAAGFVVLYLLVSRYLFFLKEIFIALLYTVGVLLPSVAVTNMSLPWLLIVHFFLIALTNLILFSWFDFERDKADGSVSFVTLTGEDFSKWALIVLIGTGFIFTIVTHSASGYILGIMNVVLLSLLLLKHFFSINDRFRIIGDMIFFIPLAYCFL